MSRWFTTIDASVLRWRGADRSMLTDDRYLRAIATAIRAVGPDAPIWTTARRRRATGPAGRCSRCPSTAPTWKLVTRRSASLVPELSADGVDYFLAALAAPSAVPFFRPEVVELRGTGQRLCL